MKNIYIVTSAIATKYGIYQIEERLNQTIQTLDSIHDNDEHAHIILVDSSMERPLTAEESTRLLTSVDTIINLYGDKDLKKIYDIGNHNIVKNYSEMIMMTKVLKYIDENFKEGRVFKLSGRYTLTKNFDLKLYDLDDIQDKIVFSLRRKSQFSSKVTGGVDFQFMCRLYSFPAHRSLEIRDTFKTIMNSFATNFKNKIYTDLEHSMFREFGDKQGTAEVERVGVCGYLGPNGVYVED